MQQLALVVGQHRQHHKLLYIFCFPSSLEIGMLRSVPEDDRGAVIVSTPSIDRLEVISAPVTPAGSLYFLRNSLDTKPWSSCQQNNDVSTERAGESVWVFLHGLYLDDRLTCLASCLACIVMNSSSTLTDSSSGEKCFTSR